MTIRTPTRSTSRPANGVNNEPTSAAAIAPRMITVISIVPLSPAYKINSPGTHPCQLINLAS